jgi:hypothetical protein
VLVPELLGDGAHGVGAARRVFLPLIIALLPGIYTAIEESQCAARLLACSRKV